MMSDEKKPKAKKLDTPETQLLRAFSIVSEHSDACVVLIAHRGGLFLRYDGGPEAAADMIRIANRMTLPDRRSGEVSVELGDCEREDGA